MISMVNIFLLLLMIVIPIFIFFVKATCSFAVFTAFGLDILALFIFIAYTAHTKIVSNIASGNAVYFWDIAFAVIAVMLYIKLFFLIVQRFPIVGKILNLIIAFFGVFIVYGLIVMFTMPEGIRLFPLLDNSIANQIANLLLIFIISLPIAKKRNEYLYIEQNTEQDVEQDIE